MRAFVAPGAGKKVGDQNRRDQPGEGNQFDRARRASHHQISGKRRQGDDAAEQPRGNEGAVARRGQGVPPRRRVHQGRNIISYWREKGPRSRFARPTLQTRSHFSVRIVSDAT